MRAKRPLREPVREAPGPKLKNYITPAGLQRLKDEHRFLMNRERPAVTQVVAWAASNGDRSENADYLYGKRRLRQIDSRIRFLTKRIDAAEVVDPAAPRPGSAATRVFFGATVTYKDAAGQRTRRQHRRHRRSRPEPPLHQLDVAAGARADEVEPGRPRRPARADEDRTPRNPRRRVRADSDGSVPRAASLRLASTAAATAGRAHLGEALDETLNARAPGSALDHEDGLVGQLEIPRLNVSVIVIEGDDDATLARAVGHVRGTALPWESGNTVMAGHRDTFFRPLKNLGEGDQILMTTPRGTFEYRVASRIVEPDDLSVLAPTSARSLTLVTCYPFVYVGRAQKRFIVHAQ